MDILSSTRLDYKEKYEGRLSVYKNSYFENDETSFLDLIAALAVIPLATFTTLAVLGAGSGDPPEWMVERLELNADSDGSSMINAVGIE